MSLRTPSESSEEHLYRTLFNSIDQGFCLVDVYFDDAGTAVDYRFLDTNAVFEQQTGLRDAVGRTVRELVPDLEPHWFEIYGRVASTGEPKRFVDHAPSMGRWFDVYAFRVGDDTSRTVAIFFADITERRRAQADLAFLAGIGRQLAGVTGLDDVWRVVAEGASAHLEIGSCALLELHGDAAHVVVRYAWRDGERVRFPGLHRLGHFVSDPGLRAQPFADVVVVGNANADPRVDAAAAAALGIGAFASVPLRDGGGRLAFVVGAAGPRSWRPSEIEVLRELSTRLSLRIERGRAERAVRESEERFRGLADQAPVLIWLTDAQHQNVFINAEYERFLGRPMPELLGGGWIEGVHPDDAERYYSAFVAAAERRERFEADFRFRRADGQYRWMRTVGVPRLDGETFLGYIGSTSDIHERKLAEDAIRESEERFRNMADHAPVMIWVTEPDGYCSYLNSQWFAFTGQEPAQALGFGWLEATHPDDRERSEQAFLRANAARAPFRAEYRLRRRDGTYAWAIDSAAPRFGPDGEYLGYVGSVLDITERREREAELRAANQLKDEFLATLSHELRTPLNAVVGWAHMLRSEGLPPDIRERALESLERNARAQAQIVDDLLDVSRIVSGKLHIADRAVDVSAVVASAIETVKPAAIAKQVALLLAAAPPGEVLVTGDADRLRQVVWNLLSNAVKFTPSGGRVEVAVRLLNDNAILEVRDTGEGIPPDFLPHVFERFRQADGSVTRRHGGLGLGLAIVRHIIEAHGGTVSAASEGAGQGALFQVTLPLCEPSDAGRAPRTRLLQGQPSLTDVRILVVDDHTEARELMTAILTTADAEVVTATSVQEALACLSQRRFDVVLADIGMPGQDGYALIRTIRQLPESELRGIPAVAVTAYASAADRGLALGAGFDRYVTKPINPSELVELIVSIVGRA